ncbi:MAG: TAXI family TRAP transporter solute-binding subunit [Chloroflexi bacterium]|nr:TAXI family TRAP transporter solute-binding subunit [Chloroflexota bacterium]
MRKTAVSVICVVCAAALFLISCGRAAPAPTLGPMTTPATTRTVSMSTWPAGTTSYVAGLAIGTVLSKYANIKVAVEPNASPLPSYARMQKGEVELVVSSAPFMYGTLTGAFDTPKYAKVRDLFFIYPSNYSFITRMDTGIKKVEDLKGKKVAAIYPAGPATGALARAILKQYGMDLDRDIVATRYTSVVDMYENLKERRVDAAFGTGIRTSLDEQERSPGGAYVIPMARDKILATQKEFPYVFPDNHPEGFPGAKGDSLSFYFGLGMNSGADVSEDLVYAVTRTVMEHIDEIRPAHAELANFTLANFAKYPTLPFHDGAIKYYKEKGLWTTAMETMQKGLLERSK